MRWIPVVAAVVLAGCGERGGPSVTPSAHAAEPSAAARGTGPRKDAPAGAWAEARAGGLAREVPAIGSFRARQTTRVGSQVSGRVEEVLVDVGDAVKKGQALVRLDAVLFKLEAAQREAELTASRAGQEEAQLHFDRMRKLWEKPAGEEPSISRRQFDDAKTRLDGAAARVKQADAALGYATQRFEEATIRAPFDGVITQRFVDPGEPVTSMPITQLVEVQETGLLELDFALPQELLAQVKAGTPVLYESEGVPGAGSGSVAVVFPAVEEATRSVKCRVLALNADGRLRPGLLAKVRVALPGRADAVVVPRRALERDASGGGWQVRVAGADGGTPVARSVKTGALGETEAEILGGLKAGDPVWVPAD
jgi:membrane fusion protein (multidrug efflux system)